jgi:hypothetical protein
MSDLFYNYCLNFLFVGFVCFSELTAIISLNSVNQLIFVMVKSCVFFAVRTEFLNTVQTNFIFKGLQLTYKYKVILICVI